MSLDGCGAPQQTSTAVAEDTDQVVVTGKVRAGSAAVGGAFVRLLDASGEFTAEVVTSPEGEFRFFAAPGDWKLRSLAPAGRGERVVSASVGLNETTVAID